MNSFLDLQNWSEERSTFAVFSDNKSYKYNELAADAGQIIRWWTAHPLPNEAVVAIDAGEPRAFTAWMVAALRSGYTVMPLDPAAPAARMRRLIAASGAHQVICAPQMRDAWRCEGVEMIAMPAPSAGKPRGLSKFLARKKKTEEEASGEADVLAEFPKALPELGGWPAVPGMDQIALLLYTSGSSGEPKGVQLTFGNLKAHLDTLAKVYGLTARSRLLNNLALHHADGLNQGPLLAMHVGGTWLRPLNKMGIASAEDFLASPFQLRASHVFMVPFFMQLVKGLTHWHKSAFDHSEFEMIISVSAELPAALWQEMEQLFGVRVVNVYGLTETVAGSLFAGPEDATRIPGTVGVPMDCEAQIVSGELWLRGPHISPGYRGAHAGPWTDDGWLMTGDLARRDSASGCYIIEGRIKNACNISGYLVRPEEVTEVLLSIPGLDDAVCFGRSDAHAEERLVAAVVTAPDHPWHDKQLADLHQAIVDVLRGEVEEYKIPVAFQVWPELPRGDSGKVQIPAARSLWAAQVVEASTDNSTTAAMDIPETVLACAREVFRSTTVDLRSDSTKTVGWDSMAHLDLIQRVEAKFNIAFSVSETMRANAISTLVAITESKVRKG